ncbi:MAG: hypothetical protein KDJ49_01585 [Alphaproteobacteria bacterium]|nr:hypothetical protein [Alphaproteobacteria bacterium]USO08001.1 MAG: hypothetical protein H6866_01925 [Rhodospirillales bacterium]
MDDLTHHTAYPVPPQEDSNNPLAPTPLRDRRDEQQFEDEAQKAARDYQRAARQPIENRAAPASENLAEKPGSQLGDLDYHLVGYRPRPGTEGQMVALPPYVRSYKGSGENTYVFIVPAGLRPKNWPVSKPLGSDHGHGPAAIRAHAWAIYADLLHAMHMEQLTFERKLHPGTIDDAAERVRENWDKRAKARNRILRHAHDIQHRNELLREVLEWSALNNHPPMAALTREHAYAFLMTNGETMDRQRELRAMLSEVYKAGIAHGYADTNIALRLQLPATSGRTLRQVSDLHHRLHVFAAVPHMAPE